MEETKPETRRRRDKENDIVSPKPTTTANRSNGRVPRVVFFVLCVLTAVLLVRWLSEANQDAPTGTQLNSVLTAVAAGTPTRTPRIGTPSPAPSQEEVALKKEELTELQWVEYAESLEGFYIEGWNGWIYNVRRPDDTGKSKVEISLDRFSDGSLYYYVVVLQLDTANARLLNKNQAVQFSGEIVDVTCSTSSYCTFYLEGGELAAGT